MKEVGGEAYIDADRLTTFFQENGIDPIQGAEMVGSRNYAEAVVAGTDAVVSMADLVSRLKPEQVNALADDLRMSPGEVSAREVEDYQGQSGKVDLKQAVEPAEAGPHKTILEDTYRQLVDNGTAPRVAEVYADRHARVMVNIAKSGGQDPVALHERYGLRILRSDPNVSPVDTALGGGTSLPSRGPSGMETYLAENPEMDPSFWQSEIDGELGKPNLEDGGQDADSGTGLRQISEPGGRTGSGAVGEVGAQGKGTGRGSGELDAKPKTVALPADPKLQSYQLRNAPVVSINGLEVAAGPRPPYFSFHGQKSQEATDV